MSNLFTIDDLHQYQKKGIPDFFPAYRKRQWNPATDVAADKFYHSCVQPHGDVVLRDIVNAMEMVLGIHLTEAELRPRSAYQPDFVREQCYFQQNGGVMGSYDPDVLKRSYDKVRREFRLSGLKALPLDQVPYEPSSSAGLPTMLAKADAFPQAMAEAKQLQRRPSFSPPPTVMFHRGKATDEGKPREARYVNGYPFSMSLIEGRFFYPYQSAIIQHHTPYVGGRYDYETAGLLNETQIKSRFIGLLDYSKFDTSQSAKLTSMAFKIIEESFEMTEQDKADWKRITCYFHTSPILAPDGYIYTGRRHGVPSGSCFTQLIDSIVNAICLEYCARRLHFKPIRYFVLGDDSVLGLDRPISTTAVADCLAELGIRENVKKSKVQPANEDIHFLGHECHGWKMVRPLRETLIRLVTPERDRREYHAKDPKVRRKAFIDRLRSYQDDNPDAWRALEALVLFYQMDDEKRKAYVRKFRAKHQWVAPFYYCFYNQFYGDLDSERNELQRWKLEKRQVKSGAQRGQALFF